MCRVSLNLCASNTLLAQRFTVNGSETFDTLTGLTWQRCTLGQTYSANTCINNANQYTHAQALEAASINSGSLGWRLPNVKELLSIVDTTITNGIPIADPSAFPYTNSSSFPYWTSTVNNDSAYAYTVGFSLGTISKTLRTSPSPLIRLVR